MPAQHLHGAVLSGRPQAGRPTRMGAHRIVPHAIAVLLAPRLTAAKHAVAVE